MARLFQSPAVRALRLRTALIAAVLACSVFVLCIAALATPGHARALPRALRADSALSPSPHANTSRVSVVLLNWGRPLAARALVDKLMQHRLVSEVIVSHGRPATAFQHAHPHVRSFDDHELNEHVGLMRRFIRCASATEPWVIHIDDDVLPSPSDVDQLVLEFARDPKRIVGSHGRQLLAGQVYTATHCTGECPAVLTKFMVMERDLCRAVVEHSSLVDDVARSGSPMWNGEDIFASLVATHEYKRPNYAVPGLRLAEVKDDASAAVAISANVKGFQFWSPLWWRAVGKLVAHYRHRTRMWHTATERLASAPVITSPSPERLCVVTVLFGDFDRPQAVPAEFVTPGVRYIGITDAATAAESSRLSQGSRFLLGQAPWEVRVVETPFSDPRTNARANKIELDAVWDECDVSLYMDANVDLLRHPRDIVADMPAYTDIGLVRHPFCRTLACEATWLCQVYPKRCGAVRTQVDGYVRRGLPPGASHYESSFMVRRHTRRVRALMRAWWHDLSTVDHNRDQVPFSPLLSLHGFAPRGERAAAPIDAADGSGDGPETPHVHLYAGHGRDFGKWRCHAAAMGRRVNSFGHGTYCVVYYVFKRYLPFFEPFVVSSISWIMSNSMSPVTRLAVSVTAQVAFWMWVSVGTIQQRCARHVPRRCCVRWRAGAGCAQRAAGSRVVVTGHWMMLASVWMVPCGSILYGVVPVAVGSVLLLAVYYAIAAACLAVASVPRTMVRLARTLAATRKSSPAVLELEVASPRSARTCSSSSILSDASRCQAMFDSNDVEVGLACVQRAGQRRKRV